MGSKTGTDASQKIHKWHMWWKSAQHPYSLGKCKLKPQWDTILRQYAGLKRLMILDAGRDVKELVGQSL